jgi:hypothetical protein
MFFLAQITRLHQISLDPVIALAMDVLNPPDGLYVTDLAKVPLGGSQVRMPENNFY